MEQKKKLHELILEGEHLQQDFKFAVSDSRKISRSLCAFANTLGGRLLIGVKDNGAVAGVRTDEEFFMIESAAGMYSYPEIQFDIYTWDVNGKTVLQVNVEESRNKPHFVKNTDGSLDAYIRIADENILAPDVLVRAWQKQKQPAGTLIRYTEEEEKLFQFFSQHQTATLEVLISVTGSPLKEMVETLSNLIIVDIISYEFSGSEFVYQLK